MSAIDQSLIGNKMLRFEVCLKILFHNTIPDKKTIVVNAQWLGNVSLHYTVDRRISEFFIYIYIYSFFNLYIL